MKNNETTDVRRRAGIEGDERNNRGRILLFIAVVIALFLFFFFCVLNPGTGGGSGTGGGGDGNGSGQGSGEGVGSGFGSGDGSGDGESVADTGAVAGTSGESVGGAGKAVESDVGKAVGESSSNAGKTPGNENVPLVENKMPAVDWSVQKVPSEIESFYWGVGVSEVQKILKNPAGFRFPDCGVQETSVIDQGKGELVIQGFFIEKTADGTEVKRQFRTELNMLTGVTNVQITP